MSAWQRMKLPQAAPGAAQALIDLVGRRSEYWRRTCRITAQVLVMWLLVTIVVTACACDFPVRWPFSLYAASQVALVLYLVLVAWYAHRMDRLDRDQGLSEDQPV